MRVSQLVDGLVRRSENPFRQIVWYSPPVTEGFVTAMAPKAGRRGTKRKAAVQTEEEKPSVEEKKDRGEEEHGQDGQRVVIEHWRAAEEVKSALLAARPELTVVLNPEKPRKKSFDITLLDGGKETSLWIGIKMGPPARLKFPQPDVVVAALEEALKAE